MSIKDKMSLQQYTSIVTGGATGLGKSMASALAEMGSNIVIADINRSHAEATAEELRSQYGVRVYALEANVCSPEDVRRVREETVREFGRIDVLINNAGIVRNAKAEDVLYQDWLDVMDVNLNGVFLMSQTIGQEMIRQRKGSIINISSMSGIIVNTPQCQIAYNVSKAGVISLTKTLAAEWAPYGIRVNTIAPGYMKTELTEKFFREGGQLIDRWMSMTPMGRPGVPDELQGIAVYLASEASSYTTGGVFTVDGGYTVW
ncbi:glucose 1-dehydrogenase [Paenibacillus allorhizosphaerae]|uniref:Galactitol 2-dehydrogenase n=1 Tax=Paenibacillus allorhizosphaerae TaxID=2849866 RepID=A0ABN7TGS6_9BACL|nr:glucose 1-dehydrogenase [Paenibacillus allorhizosphaerae]CAG7625737.1 Galactitol 2-dehydrogenase [Paenibacillus allorhizosphaerae]